MPCTTQPNLNAQQKDRMRAAIDRLGAALGTGSASLVIGPSGSIAFRGFDDREGVSDLCAYRALAAANSPELRRAVARAEAMSGRKIDAHALAAGVHSHDGGRTWGAH